MMLCNRAFTYLSILMCCLLTHTHTHTHTHTKIEQLSHTGAKKRVNAAQWLINNSLNTESLQWANNITIFEVNSLIVRETHRGTYMQLSSFSLKLPIFEEKGLSFYNGRNSPPQCPWRLSPWSDMMLWDYCAVNNDLTLVNFSYFLQTFTWITWS